MPWEDSGYGLRLLPEPHFDCNHVHGHIDGLQVTGSSHRPGAICRLLREIVDSEEAQVSRRTIERFSKWCHWNGTGAALHHAHAIALALFGNIPMRFLNERDGPIPDRDEENTR